MFNVRRFVIGLRAHSRGDGGLLTEQYAYAQDRLKFNSSWIRPVLSYCAREWSIECNSIAFFFWFEMRLYVD